jgi:hypothetical protein
MYVFGSFDAGSQKVEVKKTAEVHPHQLSLHHLYFPALLALITIFSNSATSYTLTAQVAPFYPKSFSQSA